MSAYDLFLRLLPARPTTVGKVIAHNADGTSTIQFPNGSTFRAQGQPVAVNTFAFIRDGEVRGEAPAITPVVLDV